ncbi:glycosyltransferase family 4 protein [bacterium]|nr:glycosyltransferase family 4 protein [bacterium]MCP5463064.1 glycosyltransferase family 4 protein [bacterium]
MKSRVLSICLIAPPKHGSSHSSTTMYVSELARGLASRGNTVHILTTPLSDTTLYQNSSVFVHTLEGITPHCSLRRFVNAARKTYNKLNTAIDIVHCVDIPSKDITGEKKAAVTTLLSPHITAQPPHFFYSLFSQNERNARRIISGSDTLITLSASLRRHILRHCRIPVCFIPGGYAQRNTLFKNAEQNSAFDTTIVLSLIPDYSPAIMKRIISSWQLISVKKARLLILTNRKNIRLAQRLANTAQNEENRISVYDIGMLESTDFPATVTAAVIHVKYPFDWIGEIPLLLSAGIPIIGIGEKSLAEYIGDAGVFCRDNPADIADTIRYLMDETESRFFLRCKAKERVKHFFSVENMIKQTLALYWDILKHTRHHNR